MGKGGEANPAIFAKCSEKKPGIETNLAKVGGNYIGTRHYSLADLRGAPGTRAPLGLQILSFSCSFWQKFEK